MPPSCTLRAWIEPTDDGRCGAVFISVNASHGVRPAMYLSNSYADAREHVESVAISAGFAVEWVDRSSE